MLRENGRGNVRLPCSSGELLEKAQQLFADGAAGEHLDPAAQMQRLFREQLEEVRYDLAVAGAGVFAALCDLVIAHEDDAAVLAALDERAAVAKAGERQLLAKDTALVHAFKHGAVAVGVQAQKRRAAESSTPIISCCCPQVRMVCPALKRCS